MGFLLALLLLTPAMAADAPAGDPGTADKATVELVQYVLKTPTDAVSTKMVDPFLAVDASTLPPKLRGKAAAKQEEIKALLRIHERKKVGTLVYPAEGCSEKDFVKPLAMAPYFASPQYEKLTEDEIEFVKANTKCTETDLGCRFSLLIFFEKKKDRVLKMLAVDPIMALVAQSHGGGGNSHLFGLGTYTCEH